MLGEYWLVIPILLLVASIVLQQVPLLLVALLFVLAGGASRLWGHYCLSRVEYRRNLSSDHVFFGEEVYLDLEIYNRKLLPLPWLQVDDELSEDVTLLKGKTSSLHIPGRILLTNLFSINWYHKIKRRYPIRCLQRGYFVFGPARIRSGDLFGFFKQEKQAQELNYLSVYPKILPIEKLGIPSTQPIGNLRTKNYLFQDPMLTLGIRDYNFGDSMKRIHWKNSARLGQLQTKVYEPTTTMDMGIFLDVRTTRAPLWGNVTHLFELAIITAASIANHAITSGYSVGLYVNHHYWFSSELIRIPPSQHLNQMRNILEALSQVNPTEITPISELVIREGRKFSWGSSVVVVTAMPTDSLLAALYNIKRTGRKVALITVGDDAGSSISPDSLDVYNIKEDLNWYEMEAINIGSKQ